MQNQSQAKSLLRRPDVERRTGMKKSTIYARMKEGTFPQSVSLGRTVAWVEDEIESWINSRIKASRAETSHNVGQAIAA